MAEQLQQHSIICLYCKDNGLGHWDSALPSFLLQCHGFCTDNDIRLDIGGLPEGTGKLLAVATAVKAHKKPEHPTATVAQQLDPRRWLKPTLQKTATSVAFIGEISLALFKLIGGRAKMRGSDLLHFIYQAGPGAFAIITLTSFLVGMILAYLGAAQLGQFGAQIYVADLVTVGMLREMGALMTAVVMAGRTGAAYAAQLGTMQTNEEIDAITTLGISPIEFLVLPRLLALVAIMPLLCIYANTVGIFGGAVVAAGMDVSLTQFLVRLQGVFSLTHLNVGLLKSVVFGVLIAVAGCRAGMQCGRSSAAVGQATTGAVVTAIVYLIIADAGINILFQKMGV